MALFARIANRLSYRIALVASLVAGAFILAIGGASYAVVHTLMARGIDDVVRQSAELHAKHVGGQLRSLASTLDSLAKNSLIENALVDSAGRALYLIPFLDGLTQIGGIPVRATVTDFEGKPLVSARERPAGLDLERITSLVVETEAPVAEIAHGPKGAVLVLAEPVIFGLTGRAEGAMLVELPLQSLLPKQGRAPHIEGLGGARLVYRDPAVEAPGSPATKASDSLPPAALLHVSIPVDAPYQFARLDLAVEVTVEGQLLIGPLERLFSIYLGLGAIVMVLVLFLSLGAGRLLVRPLGNLERVVQSVIDSGSYAHRFPAGGVDEVARLGGLFNGMLERLGAAHTRSEQQGAALRESEKRYRAIFEMTTAAILEVDITPLAEAIAGLGRQGITDLAAYLDQRPEALRQLSEHTAIVQGNLAAWKMFELPAADGPAWPLDRIFPRESYPTLQGLIVATADRRTGFSAEVRLRTPGGRLRDVLMGAYLSQEPGQSSSMLLSMVDITERKAAERHLHDTNAVLSAIGRAQAAYISSRGEEGESAAFDALLDSFLKSTGSEYGFIGEVCHNADGQPYLRTHAITDVAWNEETRRLLADRGPRGLVFTNLNTLFGAVVTEREAVIANEPAKDRRSGGVPPGHPPLNAFLGIPFLLDNQVVGMAGIANRPGGYDLELIRSLHPLIATCTGLIRAIRNESRRRQSERQPELERQELSEGEEIQP